LQTEISEIQLVQPWPWNPGSRLLVFWDLMGKVSQKITAIKLQKRNHQRVNIFLEGEFAFGLSRIVAAWLEVGQELSEEKIAQLQAEDENEVAFQRSVKFIGYRMRAAAEVRDKLRDNHYPEEVIETVIERLQRDGLIDDERFAQIWVENRAEFRPRSHRVLAYELRQKGIAREVIDEALAETIEDEELAYRAGSKQSRKLRNLEWPDFRRKLAGFLARRGFSYDIVAPVVDRIWTEQGSDGNTRQ
jgi:regulatory protein